MLGPDPECSFPGATGQSKNSLICHPLPERQLKQQRVLTRLHEHAYLCLSMACPVEFSSSTTILITAPSLAPQD
jgi:hypothetical protein